MNNKINIIQMVFTILLIFLIIQGCNSSSEKSVRSRIKFNTDWKFINEDVANAESYNLDDSGWRLLDLPHDWAIERPFTKNVSFAGGYLPYPGVGWYRKNFELNVPGKNVLIEFDGIMRDAKIWLNGEYIGEWPYGYTSFSFDMTQHIKIGEKNVLAVRVVNEDNSSRWYPGSGIYRNVWLTITDPIHIEHWGTFVTTPQINDKSALVNLESWVINNSETASGVLLETYIVDKLGKTISSVGDEALIKKGARYKFNQKLIVEKPHRWDIKDPYMYTAITIVKKDNTIIDRYETPFGIRTFHFDANKGFFLNGRGLKIKGVNLHSDLGPLGTAVSYRATERQLEIMKEMGANAIRTAHNPPSVEQLELCDKMGILVLDEAFDEWRVPKLEKGYSRIFDKWAEKDMRAMIKRDRNHPSVILWSIGNEVYQLGTEDGKKSGTMLADICRDMDPTRPVTSGIHLSIILDQEVMDIFDVAGLNYWHESIRKVHKEFPEKPLIVTESAAVLSSRGVYQFPVERIYRGFNNKSLQISSYDLVNTGFGALPDVEFKLQDENKWLAGQFVWSGFDYHGEPDPFEDMWPAHSSYFGIVDMCGFPKDRYYLYQSVWTNKPMIHLLPHWNWEGREGMITPVFVYTNCASAELYVNGFSKGIKRKEEGIYRLKWEDIIYQPGSIKAVGYDEQGNILVGKEITTAGKPKKIEIKADRNKIKADGEDLSFVTCKLIDDRDNFCPTADNLISFKIEGKGEIFAVGNGNPISIESYRGNQRKLFNGLCLVIVKSTHEVGSIKLTATSKGLIEKSITINSINID